MSLSTAINQPSTNNLGAVVGVSVRMGRGTITLNQVRNAILNHPGLPDDWAPDPLNPLSIYLRTIAELGSCSSKHLLVPPSSNFKLENHSGYLVDRIKYNKHADIPATHRVHHKKKADKERDGETLNDIDVDDALIVYLRREFGNVLHDAAGSSRFEICIDRDKVNDEDFHVFEPFIYTLNKWFDDRCNGVYTSDQIRQLIYQCIHSLKGENVLNGMYFIDEEHTAKMRALGEAFRDLDEGIRIVTIPIPKYTEGGDNTTFHEIRPLVEASVLDTLAELQEELEAMSGDDKKPRDSTWDKKLGEFLDLQKKVELYKAEQVIIDMSIDSCLEDIKMLLDKRGNNETT